MAVADSVEDRHRRFFAMASAYPGQDGYQAPPATGEFGLVEREMTSVLRGFGDFAVYSRQRIGRRRPAADMEPATKVTDDESERGKGTTDRRAEIAGRVIALLNRTVAWTNARPARRVIIYGTGSVAAAALILGLRFGPDLPALVDNLGNAIAALRAPAIEPATPTDTAAAPTRPKLPHDPLAVLPQQVVADLTRPVPETQAQMGRVFSAPPQQVCDDLGQLGLTGAKLTSNELAPAEWNCDTDVVAVAPASKPDVEPSSLYVSVRGDRPGRISILRLKLNLTDPASAAEARRRFAELIAALHSRFFWDLPDGVLKAIDQLKSAHVEHYGLSYDIHREWGDVPRLNVVITATNDTGILSTGAFQGSISLIKPERHAPPSPGPARLPEPSLVDPGIGETPAASGPIESITR